jgi:hypothetical protein
LDWGGAIKTDRSPERNGAKISLLLNAGSRASIRHKRIPANNENRARSRPSVTDNYDCSDEVAATPPGMDFRTTSILLPADEETALRPHGTIAACETTANASERPPTYCSALQAANHWLALASIGGRVERAMGIENIAVDPILY